jgi:inhibitor of KinA
MLSSYNVFPLGDSAIMVDFGNIIDETVNEHVISLVQVLIQQPLPGMIEAVPAYSSITIYYDIVVARKKIPAGHAVYEWMSEKLNELVQLPVPSKTKPAALTNIPVCYEKEFAPDIESLALHRSISVEEVIRIHTSTIYRVFMLGFLPGFSYMGKLDERIAMSRKPQPVTVAAGSVGIAGRQTGIYPLVSPGGWQIIGRTPIQMFNKENEGPTFLKAGDHIQFIRISKDEFANY